MAGIGGSYTRSNRFIIIGVYFSLLCCQAFAIIDEKGRQKNR
jgi:hypothetical protein